MMMIWMWIGSSSGRKVSDPLATSTTTTTTTTTTVLLPTTELIGLSLSAHVSLLKQSLERMIMMKMIQLERNYIRLGGVKGMSYTSKKLTRSK
jgi:hypothetical protein